MEDIIAYHHTSKEAGESIMLNGFDPKYFKKISLGFGVQCFFDKFNEAVFKGKEDGQIEVLFKNCILLEDRTIINESLEKIQRAEPHEKQIEVAKSEAERIKKLGYHAYKIRALDNKMGIVFLEFPQPVAWIPFQRS